jgi:hypothetical protein
MFAVRSGKGREGPFERKNIYSLLNDMTRTQGRIKESSHRHIVARAGISHPVRASNNKVVSAGRITAVSGVCILF